MSYYVGQEVFFSAEEFTWVKESLGGTKEAVEVSESAAVASGKGRSQRMAARLEIPSEAACLLAAGTLRADSFHGAGR